MKVKGGGHHAPFLRPGEKQRGHRDSENRLQPEARDQHRARSRWAVGHEHRREDEQPQNQRGEPRPAGQHAQILDHHPRPLRDLRRIGRHREGAEARGSTQNRLGKSRGQAPDLCRTAQPEPERQKPEDRREDRRRRALKRPRPGRRKLGRRKDRRTGHGTTFEKRLLRKRIRRQRVVAPAAGNNRPSFRLRREATRRIR